MKQRRSGKFSIVIPRGWMPNLSPLTSRLVQATLKSEKVEQRKVNPDPKTERIDMSERMLPTIHEKVLLCKSFS